MDVLDPSQCQRHFAQAAGSPIQGEKGLRAPLDYPSLAGSSGARGALRKALTDPRVAVLARSLRIDLSDESAWEEIINRAAHALEPNAHGTECHPQKMKHAIAMGRPPPFPTRGGLPVGALRAKIPAHTEQGVSP
jgi:hypothetical protein